jgi:hypothetical protein
LPHAVNHLPSELSTLSSKPNNTNKTILAWWNGSNYRMPASQA